MTTEKTQISVDDSLPWGPWARRINKIDLSPSEHQLPPKGKILKNTSWLWSIFSWKEILFGN